MRWLQESMCGRQQTADASHAKQFNLVPSRRHIRHRTFGSYMRVGFMLCMAGFVIPSMAWQTVPQPTEVPNTLASDEQVMQAEPLNEAATNTPREADTPSNSRDNALPLADPQVVQLYSQDELLVLIRQNQHLKRVKQDDCQLVRDIEARADIMKLPSYQFLFGDMLAYGVCVPKDIERGWDLMQAAALQGLPEGLEQLGRYYHLGKFVQKDSAKARQFLFQAAAMGNLPAKIRLAEMMLQDEGSPVDYETVYRWLHHAVTADDATHQRIAVLLGQLAKRMPAAAVRRAQQPM